MSIRFYKEDPVYGVFSNFFPALISIEGQTWPSVEFFFQASKFHDPGIREMIRNAATPGQAKRMGGRMAGLRPDWDQVKEDVMRAALLAKFTQHEDLRELLLSTGKEELVEAAEWDAYWGDGRSGDGLNRLGHLLMELREDLRER